MTLDDIYTQLSHGELRQLFLGGQDITDPTAGLSPEQYPKLLSSVQLGLTELHKRFFLRQGRLAVELQPGITTYRLTPEFAESNIRSREPVKYIKDAGNPFRNELFKVEQVWGVLRDTPFEIPVNQSGFMRGIHMPNLTTLVLPTDVNTAPWMKETSQLDVLYRADHPEINVHLANAYPAGVQIELPNTHMEALCFYIASRIHNPIGMTPGAMHEGNNYFQRFLAAVAELKNQGSELDREIGDTKFSGRGFV